MVALNNTCFYCYPVTVFLLKMTGFRKEIEVYIQLIAIIAHFFKGIIKIA